MRHYDIIMTSSQPQGAVIPPTRRKLNLSKRRPGTKLHLKTRRPGTN